MIWEPLGQKRMDAELSTKKRVLVAVVPEVEQSYASLVSQMPASITYVHRFDQAVNLLLSTDYDLIIAGVHFDDSRALELLQRTKQLERNQNTPFVVLRISREALGPGLTGSVQLAVRELGGAEYFDLTDSVVSFEQSKFQIVQALETLMNGHTELSSSRNSPG
jgi:CheY-like chemotaxis protein